jgi:hypothetical protein
MPSRQQLLLGALALIAVLNMGDWVLNSMIQGPLKERRARTEQLQKDIAKKEKLIAETRNSVKQIAAWKKQSLPSDPEVARTVYRSWLLQLVKSTKLRNAVVDSGSPAARRTKSGELLFRTMSFSVRCRGGLSEFNAFLFELSKAGHLHQVSSLTLNPVGVTGQFDIFVGIDTLLLADRSGDTLNKEPSNLLASPALLDYSAVVKNNIFGVGLNAADPMKHTMITAITFSDGKPQIWIAEELTGRTIRAGLNEPFTTVALTGQIVKANDTTVVIESSGEHFLFSIGKPFSEAVPVDPDKAPL